MSPRMIIVWRVLRRALDVEDCVLIEACRRLIVADRLGWKRHSTADDWNLVMTFYYTPEEIDE